MRQGNGPDGADRVAEEAAGWFTRLQAEDASGDDWLAFEQWLQASPAHAPAYEHVERLWAELDDRGDAIERALDAPQTLPRHARRNRPALTRRTWLAAGGGAIAASLAAVVFVGRPPVLAPEQVYVAPPGQLREITLADGTHIHLNACSRIVVRLDRDARRVTMSDAEAVFDVAHDARRPFLITVGDRQVRIVGTEFDLRDRDQLMVLTVRRGVVEVRPTDWLEGPADRLTVGEELTHQEGSPTSYTRMVDPAAAFGWTTGQLIYENQPLSVVAADLTRRFGVTIRPADAQVAQLRFTGVLVADNEQAVLHRLQRLAPVEMAEAPDAIILKARATP